MKFLAVVLVVALRLYSVAVLADEEVKEKFDEVLETFGTECHDLHPLKEEDIEAFIATKIMSSEDVKCFFGCVYEKLGLISGNEFNPTQFKMKVQEWFQDDPEKYEKTLKVVDTCTVKVKEANPNGGDACALAPSIMECQNAFSEEVRQHIDTMITERRGA